MSALPDINSSMTKAEYLAFERASAFKHEFIDGEVYAMSGASEPHNLIVSSTNFTLYGQLRGRGCKIYLSDMKVHTPSTGSFTYPDITVVCGDAELNDKERDVLLNPTLIIEVLSPTTEQYDRGKKFQRYREIPSLQEYVLIAQDTAHIEHFLRQDDGLWLFNDVTGLDSAIDLTSIGCTLKLSDVYEQVDFSKDGQPHDE